MPTCSAISVTRPSPRNYNFKYKTFTKQMGKMLMLKISIMPALLLFIKYCYVCTVEISIKHISEYHILYRWVRLPNAAQLPHPTRFDFQISGRSAFYFDPDISHLKCPGKSGQPECGSSRWGYKELIQRLVHCTNEDFLLVTRSLECKTCEPFFCCFSSHSSCETDQ
jgi:hypothetical protein